MKRKNYKPFEANIKSDAAYDPFPKTGLVTDYEPFIGWWVADFCKQFRWVSYQDALNEAVLRATTAAQRFKPELGYDFSTYLRHYLKKLYAMQEEEKGTDWAQDQKAAPKARIPARR